MDAFYDRLIIRAATIDELLSDKFEPLPGQKSDADLAARRLAAWCKSCASGDWTLFGQRLARDGWTIDAILKRFATVRRKASAPAPAWVADAIWIETALQSPRKHAEHIQTRGENGPCAFEDLLTPVVKRAVDLLWSDMDPRVFENLTESAHACLYGSLLKGLSDLSAPAIYEQFVKARKTAENAGAATSGPAVGTGLYDRFVAEMNAGGFRNLFEEKPVLLRLLAVITRQWIETSRKFVLRLDADLPAIRRDILCSNTDSRVARIDGDLSDPHNGGHSVRIISFVDGLRVVYKPKDLRLDIAWRNLIERLNQAGAPIKLRTVRAISPDGYGWTELIEHTEYSHREGDKQFFRRAGAWLALFHCFVANDMHQENMIAAGDHPVPIDLETILQSAAEGHETSDLEAQAFDLATEKLANSVMMVGLLPAYGRSPDNNVFAIGGMTADWNSKIKIKWENVNSDAMRPKRSKETGITSPNLPHINGRYAKFADHIDDFVSGFEDYAKFLLRQTTNERWQDVYEDFTDLPVRKVVRATRFYAMLLQRLRNFRTMDDGVLWSAQADFIARLAEWDKGTDAFWPLQRAERSALIALNVPHFVSPSDGIEIGDATGISIRTDAKSGLSRARARMQDFNEHEINWQIEVIRENTRSLARPSTSTVNAQAQLAERSVTTQPTKSVFIAEADWIAEELSRYAIRRGPGAAWIGLDCLGDAEAFQLVCLGSELYNGVSGIALFLAAHAVVTGRWSSAELGLAGVSYLRKNLKSRNAARMARSLGIGAATGLGSIVYSLAVISRLLNDDDLLSDAHVAARLFTDELIAADRQLDVIGGSAGAILGLLRLYRDSQSEDVLNRAIKCGEHLMAQDRLGPAGLRSWVGQGSGNRPLNGMSHGAAGFAYALALLASASGRENFAQAASECIAFENSTYDAGHHNWPDLRGDGQPSWPCQWCHGATGIGLARIAMAKRGGMDPNTLANDIQNAVEGATKGWPSGVDTLCCGTLGSIEFFCEASSVLGRKDLGEIAARRLMSVLERAASSGDYRWNSGKRNFNLGLFRGLAGVGYTSLRQADNSLPNVIIWD
jgi:type 2 lantibiotic biosynthesis protein LanM